MATPAKKAACALCSAGPCALSRALLAALLLAAFWAGSLTLVCNNLHAVPPKVQGHTAPVCVQLNAALAPLQQRALELGGRTVAYLRDAGWVSQEPIKPRALLFQLQLKACDAFEVVRNAVRAHLPASMLRTSLPIPFFPMVLPQSALAPLVAPGHGDALDDLYTSVLRFSHEKQKAVGLALACTAEPQCSAAAQALLGGANSKAFKHISGEDFTGSDAAGNLQLELATFLSAAPNGVVVVTNLDSMSVGGIAVLNNALSEAGGLQLDGATVRTGRALFVLVTVVPGASGAEFESAVKDAIQVSPLHPPPLCVRARMCWTFYTVPLCPCASVTPGADSGLAVTEARWGYFSFKLNHESVVANWRFMFPWAYW